MKMATLPKRTLGLAVEGFIACARDVVKSKAQVKP